MTVTLDEVCVAIVDCEHRTAPIDPEGVHFAVGTPAMRGNRIDLAQARRISRETYLAWTQRLAPSPGDLLLAREAPVGPVVMIPESPPVAPGQRTVLLRTNPHHLHARFAFYLLTSPAQQSRLMQQAEGSTVPHLNVADVRLFELPALPTLEEQRAIAATLGALDDKIESNRRIASLTLDLAEALFLESCMQGSDLLPLRDAGTWLSGGTPSTSSPDFWDGELPWISAASLKDFFIWNSERRLTTAGEDAATNIVPEGTLLMVVRGMSLKTEFRFGVAQRRVAFGQDCKAIIPRIPSSMLALGLRASQRNVLDLVDEAGHGTGRLSTDLLAEHEIEIPVDTSVTRRLDALLSRGAVAKTESNQLASLRDALLPELLTGRIRAAEASTEVRSALSRGETA